MQEYPHRYPVAVAAQNEGNTTVSSPGLPQLSCAPPSQFGGPGDQWSPETLLAAAVADCFVLTFRAIARASKLPWQALQCEAEGILDKVDGTTRFTRFVIHAHLTVAAESDVKKGQRLLEKAEQACLITNSLSSETELKCEIKLASDQI